jgi:hypothetical protein
MPDTWIRPFPLAIDDLQTFVERTPEHRYAYFLSRWERCGVALVDGGVRALQRAVQSWGPLNHRLRHLLEGVGRSFPVQDAAQGAAREPLDEWETFLGSHKVPDCLVLVDHQRQRLEAILRDCARGASRVTIIDRYVPGKCIGRGGLVSPDTPMGHFLRLVAEENVDRHVELAIYTGEYNYSAPEDEANVAQRRVARAEVEANLEGLVPTGSDITRRLFVFKKNIFHDLCHDRFIAFEHAKNVRHVLQVGNGFDALAASSKDLPPVTVSRVLPKDFIELRKKLDDAWDQKPQWRAPS